MALAPILLVGPFVAAVGLAAVIFVMRHRSVQTKSMYSARRSQIEHKVRAARQRTLAPTGRHSDKEAAVEQAFTASGMEAKAAVPTATWGPTVMPEPQAPPPPPPPPSQQAWEVGPTVPPPPPSVPPPTPPPYRPSAPAYTPPEPAYPPPEPAYQPAPPDSTWTPAPPEPVAPSREPEPQVASPAGGGASWSVVGETKSTAAEPVPDKKSKKEQQAQAGSWQLASGSLPGDEPGEDAKRPSATLAVAQYAVLVVGLVMVLIGVVVMLANSHVT
jgi:hypothetical protein